MPAHVLVAMDSSPQATAALEFALTEFPDAAVTVLHVSNPIDGMYFAGEESMYVDFEEIERRSTAETERIFETAREIAEPYDADVETVSKMGSPARAIVAYVDDHDVDHVVVGSHGRSGVDRLLLGSVAELVVRRSSVPVTVVR